MKINFNFLRNFSNHTIIENQKTSQIINESKYENKIDTVAMGD